MTLSPTVALFGGREMGHKESLKKFKIRNILEVFIISIILLVSVSSGIVILTTDTEDAVHFIVGNETYTVDETMDFSSITIAYSYIIFNTTGFCVTSGNNILISLVYLNDDINDVSDGDKVLEFYADTSSRNVWFNLSGFPVGNEYVVNRDGNPISYPNANSSGYISFSDSIWSRQHFEIFQVEEGTGDTTNPVIKIIKPGNVIYINNNKIVPFFTPIIIGAIDIEAQASDDESGIDYVEFYIDGKLRSTDATAPYSWTWDEITFFQHVIKTVAYDNADNRASRELIVWKFL